MLNRFRSIRFSLRFIAPLVLTLGVLAYALVPVVDNLTLRWWTNDLDLRARLIANTMQDQLAELVAQDNWTRVRALFVRALQDDRLYAVAYCTPAGDMGYATPTYPPSLGCTTPSNAEGERQSAVRLAHGLVHVSQQVLKLPDGTAGSLMLVHDMSFVERRSEVTRRYVLVFFVVLGIVISLVTVLIAHMSWRGWVAGMRAMLRGEGIVQPFGRAEDPDMQPLLSDLRALMHQVDTGRRLRPQEGAWTPDTLRAVLNEHFPGDQILLLSNREPYSHVREETGGIAVRRPASGLVTAMEPIMRACSGTWVAHGSGSADREVVDARDRISVPPEHPSYTLRRVWLTDEEQNGYYYGFANEGLWPLCHLAHVRPVFRADDWAQYEAVNQRFADAVCAEARADDPVVLIQDYHFALAPRLIAQALPKATVITFWHIPWPNAEAFGICPWRDEILEGMLGSTILGFHTRVHRQNFIDTVDRYLEARIEHESSIVSYRGSLTRVENYPISVQWPPEWAPSAPDVASCRARIYRQEGLRPEMQLGVGVDRMDYTKGILERFAAIERLLETQPAHIGRFVFVQIASPTRSSLPEYRNFEERVRASAERINGRFGRLGYAPIHLRTTHHTPEVVHEYYRAADVCLVTSLHDGMNLVAKEFVAARDDAQGVLVLSQFTGAARELHDALLVNPYHIEQCAVALHRALTMPPDEQRVRMQSMRRLIAEFNIYWWAGAMLLDAARVRQRRRVTERIERHRGGALRRVS